MFQFFYPGVPGIYYGDEIGLEGGKDPDSRRAFPWEAARWDRSLRDLVQRLVSLRRQLGVLRRGEFIRLMADDAAGVSAFARKLNAQVAILALNPSGSRRAIRVPVEGTGLAAGQNMQAAVGPSDVIVADNHLDLALGPWEGALLHT